MTDSGELPVGSGQIYVDSKPGKGTTFTLTIPFSVAEDRKQ